MPSPPSKDTDPHHVISSYFIGPKAENLDSFKANIETILAEVKKARDEYYPADNVLIFSFSLFAPQYRANAILS